MQTHEAHSEKAHQDALIAELRTALADMRRGRDEWREQAHRLALLAPKAEPVQPKPEPAQIEQPSRLCRGDGCGRPGALRARACCSPYRPCPRVLNSSSRATAAAAGYNFRRLLAWLRLLLLRILIAFSLTTQLKPV